MYTEELCITYKIFLSQEKAIEIFNDMQCVVRSVLFTIHFEMHQKLRRINRWIGRWINGKIHYKATFLKYY